MEIRRKCILALLLCGLALGSLSSMACGGGAADSTDLSSGSSTTIEVAGAAIGSTDAANKAVLSNSALSLETSLTD